MVSRKLRLYDLWKDNIELKDAVEDQMILVDVINNYNSSTKTRIERKKEEKPFTFYSAKQLLSGKQRVIDTFKSGIFSMEYTRFSFSDDPEKNLNVRISNHSNNLPLALDRPPGSFTQGR